MQYEVMDTDILIVGAGPAGLSAAIRLAQLAQQQQSPLSIMVLEKGANVGAHILSGAVLEPRALDELIPDWKNKNAPVTTAVTSNVMHWFTEKRRFRLPHPHVMHNHGNYIISLGRLCQWLAEQAESLGVQIMPGFAIAEPWVEDGIMRGGITGAFGVNASGEPGANYQPPLAIRAKYTLLAEGCRGSVSAAIMKEFQLRSDCQPQTYALGIKEIWQVDAARHQLGRVEHAAGWPLDHRTYGGGFIYHAQNHQLYLGYITALDYTNPYLDPYKEFQRFKTHPYVASLLEGGKCISYGARALNEGGYQSIPKLAFPGGALIGCSAGFLNVPKIKGTHTAMKSGMLAAEAAFEALQAGRSNDTLESYDTRLKQSWVWAELKAARNIRPAFAWGRLLGIIYSGVDMMLFHGKAPWTLKHRVADHAATHTKEKHAPISYPAPNGKTTFDRNSALYLSGTNHAEDQPCHLQLKNPTTAIHINWEHYASPEQRYCPAGVYEIINRSSSAAVAQENNRSSSVAVAEENNRSSSAAVAENTSSQADVQLVIHAQNCLHCKSCDIKDMTQNILWKTPEGGGGPNYQGM